MSKRNHFLSRSLDKKNSNNYLYKNIKLFFRINHPIKKTSNKFSIDCNKSKDMQINDNINFPEKKYLIKKNCSVDENIKPNSNKFISNFNLKKKMFDINSLDQSIFKDKKMKTQQTNFIYHNNFLSLINHQVKENYFKRQNIRNILNNYSTKIDKNSLTYKIKKSIRELNNHSKFSSGKKDTKQSSILSPIINYKGNQKYIFSISDLRTKKKKDFFHFNDFYISSKESVKEDEKLQPKNISRDENSDENNEKDKKPIIKTKFKISEKKTSFDLNENKDEYNKNERKEYDNIFNNIDNNNNLKIKLKFEDNENKNIFDENKKQKKASRKFEYRHNLQINQTPILNQRIILSSIITRPGMCNYKEKINQDSYLIKEKIFEENFNIYGIFDGHGDEGHLISNYISKFISNYYINESNYIFMDDEVLSSSENYKISKIFLEKNEKIIRRSQSELDKKLLSENINISFSGSTSVLLFLINDTLICSNIGDSECYLFSCSKEDFWSFESLSIIHKPTNEQEKRRILENGGEVHPYYDRDGVFDGPDRIYEKGKPYPGLSLSRSIGDLSGKKIGVISEPDIVIKKIDKSSKFVVMGSDGLWDVIKPYDVSRIVRTYFVKNDIDGACKILMKKACYAWKKKMKKEMI